MEHYLKPARTAGGTLVKPWWNPRGTFPGPRRTLEEIGGTLVEPSSGARRAGGTLVETWWNPRGTLPQTTPDHPAALAEPGGTLPQTTPDHPALAEPGGTLVEPWWNPGGTLVEPWWNPGGTLVEPLVELWWNLSSGSPRTTPEPIWAETPKLAAVGEKRIRLRTYTHHKSPGLTQFASFAVQACWAINAKTVQEQEELLLDTQPFSLLEPAGVEG